MGLLLELVRGDASSSLMREAVVSGLAGLELSVLERLVFAPGWSSSFPGAREVFGLLATCVWNGGDPVKVGRLLDWMAGLPPGGWQQGVVLESLARLAVAPAKGGRGTVKARFVRLKEEPAALGLLARADAAPLWQERVVSVAGMLAWPGKPGTEEVVVVPLSAEQKERFDNGKIMYLATCGACHQPTGLGQEGLAPPLLDSEWALGSEQRMVRIVLHGVRGPLRVKGKTYTLDMPPLAALEDDQIANVLTYVRREWGHTASPVSKETVAKIRAETEQRSEAWTEVDLLKIP